MSKKSNDSVDINKNLRELTQQYFETLMKQQEVREKNFPIDIPNEVCNYAFIQGVKFENSFMPRVHDFLPFMKCGDEELYIWTHTKNKDTALVSKVSKSVKGKKFWKNIGNIIQLSYSYTRQFEHTMDIEYKWCYYFEPSESLEDHVIYDCSDIDKYSLLNGTILKLSEFYLLSRLIELLWRDDKAYTAMSTFYASMQTHYCCLICELGMYPYKKHPSHEPELWEQAGAIAKYETAIVQACRCVEALIGKPPNKENRSRLLQHKDKWINELGINPDDNFIKGKKTYLEFYYYLFELRNSAAHSYGTIPFDLERKQAIDSQCFASLLLDGYVMKNVVLEDEAIKTLHMNRDIINRVNETMTTSRTYEDGDSFWNDFKN